MPRALDTLADTLAIGAGTADKVALAVRQFQRLMGVPSCAVGYLDPKSHQHRVIHAHGYTQQMLAGMEAFVVSPLYRRARTVQKIRLWNDNRAFTATPTVTDVLKPAGFREGTSLHLRDTDGREVGSLHLNLYTEGMSDVQLQGLSDLSGFVARELDARSRRESFGLSPREIEIVRLIVDGATNPEIAEALFISRRTVATHVENVLHKLNVHTRVSAAVTAVRHRLV